MQEPHKINPDPCLWIRDLDDIVSEQGIVYVGEIRKICECQECKLMRENQ